MVRTYTVLALLNAALFVVAPAQARAADEAKLASAVVEVVTVGAKMFNAGDQEGCLRIYQGGLLAMGPWLEGKPKTKEKVDALVARAAGLRNLSEKAFALREALETIHEDCAGTRTDRPKPLWDRLGGEKAVRVVIHEFVLAAAPDPKVNFDRNGKFKFTADDIKGLEQKLVELVSAVTGGPLKYTGKSMKESHEGMRITDAEFNAIAGHLVATLKKFNVPQKEIDELVGIVASTRKDIVEAKGTAVKPKETPLWNRLGGEKAVRAVVHDFVLAAAPDPKVNFDRNGKFKFTADDIKGLEQKLVELISAVTGGPLKYTGKSMKESHEGMKITDEEFNALAGHLIDTLKKYKVPQKEIDELVGIVASTRKDIVEKK